MERLKYITLVVLTLLIASNASYCQEVSVSGELNLRNYFAYEILSQVDERIIVYRDKGFTKEIDVFNSEMENTVSAELELEKKRVDVFSVMGQDSVFQILYGFFEKDSMHIKYRIYDRKVQLKDSMTVAKIPKKSIRRKFATAISEDKGKVLLNTVNDKDNIIFFLYDCKKRRIEWSNIVVVDDELGRELNKIKLANNGDFVLSLNSKKWYNNQEDLRMVLFKPRMRTQRFFSFQKDLYFKENLFFKHDNKNNNFIISGTYSEKFGRDTKGYFYKCKPIDAFGEGEEVNFIPFKSTLYSELLQGSKKKGRVFDDLEIQDIILRNDGGLVFISEIIREYSRRSPYNTYARGNEGYMRRGWVDYYNDDIVITNLNTDGSISWNKVLYKKQFSQDDEGVFSSFFLMKTPSRLRFLYNDEIKRNNTVSEYIMNPNGSIARNSLLSTAYQNMKLRFKDAVQISSNSIIVPSEQNYDLNLVRISY